MQCNAERYQGITGISTQGNMLSFQSKLNLFLLNLVLKLADLMAHIPPYENGE